MLVPEITTYVAGPPICDGPMIRKTTSRTTAALIEPTKRRKPCGPDEAE